MRVTPNTGASLQLSVVSEPLRCVNFGRNDIYLFTFIFAGARAAFTFVPWQLASSFPSMVLRESTL